MYLVDVADPHPHEYQTTKVNNIPNFASIAYYFIIQFWRQVFGDQDPAVVGALNIDAKKSHLSGVPVAADKFLRINARD
jgi:hypothetical protein